MSLAIAHFAIGAGAMLLLQRLLWPSAGYPRTLAVASGCWALVPDAHYVVPGVPHAFNDGLLHLAGNVFWFHTTLDGAVAGRGTRPNAALALLFLVACAVAADASSSDVDESEQLRETYRQP